MDSVTDIQKADQIEKFLDSGSLKTKPFGANISGERAYRRAERIVAAIHLLTNHIGSDEPIRNQIRLLSLKLLSDILKLRDGLRIPASPHFKDALTSLRELITHVRVLTVSGYVSAQNSAVLTEALDELGNFLGSAQRSSLSEGAVFTRDEMMAPAEAIKDIKDKDTINKRTRTNVSDTSHQSDIRSTGIMNILKSKGKLGIKDISANLPEYSEKMIQRELVILVKDGKVTKAGSKRWSIYSIAQ